MKLADVFQNGMVLQRGKPVRFFGSADESEIRVVINGVESGSCVPENGQFYLEAQAQDTSWDSMVEFQSGGRVLARLEHVRFGEVWLAGGQSNMEFTMKWDEHFKEEQRNFVGNRVSYYEVPKIYSDHQLIIDEINQQGQWFEINANNLHLVSAVAYYFAKRVAETLRGIPIGIISCNFGGSYIMSWLPGEVLAKEQMFQWHWQQYLDHCAKLDMPEYEKQYNTAQKVTSTWLYSHLFLPIYFKGKVPKFIVNHLWKQRNGQPVENDTFGPWDNWRPAGLYEYMLKKVIGISVRGVIWYQGEAEAESRRVAHYYDAMKCLMDEWKAEWQDDFPFLIVKLADFEKDLFQNGVNYPQIRAQQQKLADDFDDVFAVTAEGFGEPFNIHPPHKKPIGEQLARVAISEVYQPSRKNLI